MIARFFIRIAGMACSIASIYFTFIKEVNTALVLMLAAIITAAWFIWTDAK